MKPLVSIICLAYNHEKYIHQALEGFVMQQTDFPFEIIVHDDASTDHTAAIIKEYESKYPKLFRPIYQTENQYRLEKGRVTKIVYKAAQGKYIALCEGDDYWTDPLKLQKQVDFLEAHPDVSLCSTSIQTLKNGVFSQKPIPKTPFFFNQITLIKYNPVYTLTTLFRNPVKLVPDLSQYHFGDRAMWRTLRLQGRGVVLPFSSGVYRIHADGVYSSQIGLANLKKGVEDTLLFLCKQKNTYYRFAAFKIYMVYAIKAFLRLFMARGKDNAGQIPLYLKAAWYSVLGRTFE